MVPVQIGLGGRGAIGLATGGGLREGGQGVGGGGVPI